MLIANKLKIPFQVIKMKKEYNKYVINYMFNEYKIGKTPNPDILCNEKIKFNFFLKIATIKLKADFIATGHYVKKKELIKNNKIIYRILIGKDLNKDQSYFLCRLSQYQLKKSLFPLGNLTKDEVRKIAKSNNFCNAYKKDSQGLCFVGKIKLPEFLEKRISKKKGKVIYIKSSSSIYKNNNISKTDNFFSIKKKIKYKETDGKIIGYHSGAHQFTKGQRKGISIGGYKKALFVIDTDIEKNIIYTGMGREHPGLYRKYLFIKEKDIHWIRSDIFLSLEGEKMKVFCRIRYRQSLQKATLFKLKLGILIFFEKMQYAISEGQFAVWYLNKELIGSGIIS